MNNIDHIYTTKQTCHILSISPTTLWRLVKSGQMKEPIKISSKSGYKASDIQSFIDERTRERDQ